MRLCSWMCCVVLTMACEPGPAPQPRRPTSATEPVAAQPKVAAEPIAEPPVATPIAPKTKPAAHKKAPAKPRGEKPSIEPDRNVPETSESQGQCCKTCRKGKACGDACIARDRECTVGPGCACNG